MLEFVPWLDNSNNADLSFRTLTKSVPLRIVIYEDETATAIFLIYEIFKFRLTTPDPEVFQFPELAACQTVHDPPIPQMISSFHTKLEIKDRIIPIYESPVYDLSIHYEYDQKLSHYSFQTTGLDYLVEPFGDTTLEYIGD